MKSETKYHYSLFTIHFLLRASAPLRLCASAPPFPVHCCLLLGRDSFNELANNQQTTINQQQITNNNQQITSVDAKIQGGAVTIMLEHP